MTAAVLPEVSQGLVDASVEAGGFRVEMGRHRPGLRFSPHAHARPNLLYVLSGAFEQRVGHRTVEAETGTVIEKGAGVVHEDRFGEGPTTVLYVEVMESRVDELQRLLGLFDRPRFYRAPQARTLALRLARTCRRAEKNPLLVEALALELVVELSAHRAGSPDQTPRFLKPALALIEQRLAQPPGLDEMAAAAATDGVTLARAFRARFGETPRELVRRRRLEEAARRLATTDDPIPAIAFDLGFADQPHLTRLFRRAYAMTPGEYRRTLCR